MYILLVVDIIVVVLLLVQLTEANNEYKSIIHHTGSYKEDYISTLIELEFPAYVDNFDLSNTNTFALRILVQEIKNQDDDDSIDRIDNDNDNTIYDDGPLVVYTGNEGNIEEFVNSTGQVYLLAEHLGGRAAFIEQRFYGKSIPTTTNNNENDYTLLSTEQVLADLVGAISFLKKRYDHSSRNQQVIAIGGSYGGMLTAYLQRQHPTLITAAWASSAPLLGYADTLVQNNNQEREIYNIISRAFPSCGTDLQKAFRLLLEQPVEEIQKQLNICPSNTAIIKYENTSTTSIPSSRPNSMILSSAIGWLQGQFGLLSNLNYPYSINFMEQSLPAHPPIVACEHYHNATIANTDSATNTTTLTGAQQLIAALEWFVYPDGMEQAPCLTLNDSFYSYYLGLIPGPWTYQRCYGLIMAYEVDNENSMFLSCDEFTPNCWSQEAFNAFCRKKFNGQQPRPSKSQSDYFGVDAQSFIQQKAVLTNGMLDPWGYGGIGYPDPVNKNDVSSTPPENVIWIEDASHHLDLWWPNVDDPLSVRQARNQTYRLIEIWLHQEEEESNHYQQQHSLAPPLQPLNDVLVVTQDTNPPTTTTAAAAINIAGGIAMMAILVAIFVLKPTRYKKYSYEKISSNKDEA